MEMILFILKVHIIQKKGAARKVSFMTLALGLVIVSPFAQTIEGGFF